MNIEDLTIKQVRELTAMVGGTQNTGTGLNDFVGQKVIVRTYSAGVWFGTLSKKSGNEVILTDARRMWQWWAAESISLSAVAVYGINQKKSKIAPAVPSQWLEAIEITPASATAAESIEGAEDAKAG